MEFSTWVGYVSEWLGAIAVVMIAGVSPILKAVRRIEFRFPKREATFALSLFALVYFFAFQFFSNKIFDFLKIAAAGFPGGELSERMLLAVVSLVPFLIALLARGQPLKSIGWGRDNLRSGLTVGLLLAVLTVFLRGKFITLLGGLKPGQAGLLLVCLLLALAEETIFRGYIQLRLNSFLGSTWGWLATAVLYLFWQFPGRLWVQPFSVIWPGLLVALLQGLLLGWIMRKSGHVLAPALFRAVGSWLLLI